jgi:dolichol-phosphate mannosyltransferase
MLVPVDISVVIPVYQSAPSLRELHDRLVKTLSAITPSFEIVFVDDRSRDNGWDVLKNIAASDPRTVAIRLSRNFGQHSAIAAGLELSVGKRVVVMDCDLEDPPEMIPALIAEADKGADIVLAQRLSTHQSKTRRTINRLYFRFLSTLSNTQFDGSEGSLSLLSRRAIEAMGHYRDHGAHYGQLIRSVGFEIHRVSYERDKRTHGETSYTLHKLVDMAINAVLFQSTRLLHWVLYTGILCGVFGCLIGLGVIVLWFLGTPPPGWTSILAAISIMSGLIIISVGTVGLYVGRIFEISIGAPKYVLDQVIRADRQNTPPS